MLRFFIIVIVFLTCGFSGINIAQTSNSKSVKTSPIKTSKVDTTRSYVQWTGKKVLGQHTGKIRFQSGTVRSKSGVLSGGEFVIDMTTITNDDLNDPDYKKKLITHLSSDEFFNVAAFPTSTLKLTKVLKLTKKAYTYNLTGDLTIKGITKSVTFPATFKPVGKGFEGMAKITIDRSQWDIKYGSTSFFEGLGDKAIKNEIDLNVHLIAY
ncbi:MAG: lipid-binding protein [Bacteroidota bacterium]|nr:lipid-binding protein [Bacteroidota bacterium]